MEQQIADFISKLQQLKGKPVDVSEMVMFATTNIISSVVYNETYNHDDPKLHELYHLANNWYVILCNIVV